MSRQGSASGQAGPFWYHNTLKSSAWAVYDSFCYHLAGDSPYILVAQQNLPCTGRTVALTPRSTPKSSAGAVLRFATDPISCSSPSSLLQEPRTYCAAPPGVSGRSPTFVEAFASKLQKFPFHPECEPFGAELCAPAPRISQ